MSNFLALGHLNTFAVVAQLYRRNPNSWKGVPERGETQDPKIGVGSSLLLRCHDPITTDNWLEDLPLRDLPALVGGGEKPFDKPWELMKTLLTQARKIIMANQIGQKFLTGEPGRAMISTLKPGSTIFWHDDNGPYHERHSRFHVPLVTNPGCIMYSGPQSVHMPVGSLWYFNNRARHSAANWGEFTRIHLIFEMVKIDDEA